MKFKPVLGYEGVYVINATGVVKRVKAEHGAVVGRKLAICKHCMGYRVVSLWRENRGKSHLIHRLVWEAFNGKIPESMEINHIDGTKTNNHLSNLELVTRPENIWHGIRTGLIPSIGQANPSAVLNDMQVREILAKYRAGGIGYKNLSKQYGVNWSAIRNIVKGLRWRHIYDELPQLESNDRIS